MQLTVGVTHRGVLAHHEETLTPAVDHAHDRRVDRVVTREARQVVEAEAVLLRCRVAPVCLEEAYSVGLHIAPVA